MAIELLVLDFDGTLTRVDEEARPFLAAYRAGLRELLGDDSGWEDAASAIAAAPDAYGWEHEGRIVAPSHADPYIFATSVAQLVLSRRGMINGHRAMLEQIFKRAYEHAGIAFRPDARSVLETLVSRAAKIALVTNSHTDAVMKKLRMLGARGSEALPVFGDAKKWMLAEHDDPRFLALPEALAIEGLERPVLLRRGRYFDVLRKLWDELGTGPDRTLVCGDIYELDLALPAALGAHVHMVGRPSTPAYERDAVLRAGGSFSLELSGVLDRVG